MTRTRYVKYQYYFNGKKYGKPVSWNNMIALRKCLIGEWKPV